MSTSYTFQAKSYDPAVLVSMTSQELVCLYNEIYAAMNSAQRVTRFSDKSAGATRCLKALREYAATETLKWMAAPASEVPAPPLTGSFNTEEAAEEVCPADHVVVPVTEGLWVLEPTIMPEDDEPAPAAKSSWARMAQIPTGEKPKQAAGQHAAGKRGTNILPNGKPLEACRLGSKQALLRDTLMCNEGVTMAELLQAMSGGNKPWVEATVRSGFSWDMKQKGYGVKSVVGADGVERFHLVWPEDQTPPMHYGLGKGADHITI